MKDPLQHHTKQLDFLKAKRDLKIIFFASFVIHVIGVAMMTTYIILSLGLDVVLKSLNFSAPIILSSFIISFFIFFWLHHNLIKFFFLKKEINITELQKEVLNFPKIPIFGFMAWVLAGISTGYWLIIQNLAPFHSVIVHIVFSTFLSGSLAGILQLNVTEVILQRNLFPYLLKGTRISKLSGIIKVPSHIRILLLTFTTAIFPCLFIYFLYELNETSGELLLFVLAFTVFNALWQSVFLLGSISQPIGQIAGKLQRFHKGELEENSKPIWRTDALGQFSEMFDDLVSSIQERDFIRSTFSRYLDPSLVNDILNGRHELGGSDVDASVMFADIRGFTTLSEHLNPHDVVELLNGYFEAMVQEITSADGIPDKFLGDGLMAIWGVPGGDPNHAQKSCQAAIAMLTRLKFVNKIRKQNNLSEIKIGIGIHSGPVIAGNIGSKKKMEYTVIGDTVNISSRIEGMCKILQADLVISNTVYEKLSVGLQAQFTFAGSEQLRGRSEYTELYSYQTPVDIS